MAIRPNKQPNEYEKTDFNFSRAKSVLRGVYIATQAVAILQLVGLTITAVHERGVAVAMPFVLMLVLAPFLIHLSYSFMIGFFEIIRHLREIRNELVSARTKTSAASQTFGQLPPPNNSSLRYDSATHQYIKN